VKKVDFRMSTRSPELKQERAAMLHATQFCWRFTRGQHSPISSITLLGEEDWSKLTILQLDVGRIDNTFGVNLLAGKRGEASRFA